MRDAERAVQPRRRLEQKLAGVKSAAVTSVRDVGEREADQPGCDEQRFVDHLGTRGRSRARIGERAIGLAANGSGGSAAVAGCRKARLQHLPEPRGANQLPRSDVVPRVKLDDPCTQQVRHEHGPTDRDGSTAARECVVQQQRGPCARRDAAGDERDPSEVAADVSDVGEKEGTKQVLRQEAAPPRTVGHIEATDCEQVPSVVPVEVRANGLCDEAGRARGEAGAARSFTVGHRRRPRRTERGAAQLTPGRVRLLHITGLG